MLSVALSVKAQHQCKKPLAAESYSAEKMEGFWYEIARFQTLGGSVFQHGKVCTGFTFIPYGAEARVEYTSRVESPEAGFQKNYWVTKNSILKSYENQYKGRYSNVTGRLYPNEEMVAGNFYQKFPWDGADEQGVSWNIIYLDDKWAVEYDW